jgi:hypothetical protein
MALSRIDTTNMIEDVPQSKLDNNINFRNIIINGDMSIAQRGTSASSISSGAGFDTVDRFSRYVNSGGTWTISQSTTVPSGQGGKYYLQAHTQIPGIDDGELGQIFIFINGASDQLTNVRVYSSGSNQIFRMITAYTAELNAGDYVEVYVYQNSGDAQTAANQFFTGHKIIGA